MSDSFDPSWAVPSDPPMGPALRPFTLEDAMGDRAFQVPGLSMPVKLIRPEGSGTSRLLVVGEAGGENEQADRLPFRPYAQSGSVLSRALRETGIERNSLTITNTVLWQPKGNRLLGTSFEADAKAVSRGVTQELIAKRQPKAILALGATAFTELTGLSEISVLNGRGMIYKALPEYGGLPVVLTYHPAFITRSSGKSREEEAEGTKQGKAQGGGMSLLGPFKRDLRLAQDVARNGPPATHQLEGILEPSDSDWLDLQHRLLADPSLLVSYDFETRYSIILQGDEDEYTEEELMEITQFQVSVDDRVSYIAHWTPRVERICKQLMALSNPKLDVNGRFFDRKLLRRIDAVMNGRFIDLQSLWAHLQPDLPRNLQYIASFFSPQYGAWKHLVGQDMEEYGKHDSIRPLMAYHGILATMSRLKHPEGLTLSDSYWRFTNDVERMCLDAYSRRGIPVNRTRQVALGKELTQLATQQSEALNELVPEELKGTKQTEGLKGVPTEWKDLFTEDIKGLEQGLKALRKAAGPIKRRLKKGIQPLLAEEEEQEARILRQLAEGEEGLALLKARAAAGPPGSRWVWHEGEEDEKVYVKRLFTLPEGQSEERWALLNQFNPNSTQQVIKWIEWNAEQAKVQLEAEYAPKPVPKTKLASIPWVVPTEKDDWTGQLKKTTGKVGLARLAKKVNCPVLKGGLELREITKLRGTYVGSEGKPTLWTPEADGLVHPEYSTYTGTWQFASKNPNALNYPKHNKRWMKAVRGIIEVPSDRIVVEADYKSFHALTLGYEANDPDYMRMARLDMHSFFAATQLLGLYKASELLKESDANLKRLFKELRRGTTQFHGRTFEEVRSKEAKPTGLGVGFGMMPPTLYRNNEESFRDQDHARATHSAYLRLWRLIALYQDRITQQADQQTYLVSKHGGIRWFHCVYNKRKVRPGEWVRPGTKFVDTRDGRWIFTPGDDHEAAIAYLPANDAFGMIRAALLRLEEQGWGERFGISIPLHDAIVAFPRAEDRDLCLEVLKREMEQPSDILKLPNGAGLWCEVELLCSKPGGNWGEMEEVSL